MMQQQKNFIFWLSALVLSVSLLCSGCSSDTEKEQPTKIKQFTDHTAKQAVDHIRKPMDKARQAQALVNAHTRDIEQAVDQEAQ